MILDAAGLYDRIKRALGASNPSEIARRLNLTPQSVYLWQKGKFPSLETLAQIAGSNTSIHWLVTGEGPEKVAVGEKRALLVAEREESIEQVRDLLADDFAEAYEAMARELRDRAEKRRRKPKAKLSGAS